MDTEAFSKERESTKVARLEFEELGEATVRERIIWAPYSQGYRWNSLKIQLAELWLREKQVDRERIQRQQDEQRHREEMKDRRYTRLAAAISAVATAFSAIAACAAVFFMSESTAAEKAARQPFLVLSVSRNNDRVNIALKNIGREPASEVDVRIVTISEDGSWGPMAVSRYLANQISTDESAELPTLEIPADKRVYVVTVTRYRSGVTGKMLQNSPVVYGLVQGLEPALSRAERDRVLCIPAIRDSLGSL